MWKVVLGLLTVIAVIRCSAFLFQKEVSYSDGTKIKVEGVVEEDVRKTWNERESFKVGKIQIISTLDQKVEAGQRIKVIGTINSRLIRDKELNKWLEAEQILILDEGVGLTKMGILVRESLRESIVKSLPNKEGALASGIVWGDTTGFSYEMRDMFRKSGLSHIVAASGFNVTLLASWVTIISARWLRRKMAIFFVLLSILLYMFLAGWTTPIIRAGVMAIITALTILVGKQVRGWYVLLITSLSMLVLRPEWLVDVSFQLSVMATVAILFGSNEKNGFLIDDWRTTVGVYITTFPIIAYHFGIVNIWGLVANPLILWIVPLITQLGMIISIAGIVSQLLAQVIAALVYLPLKFVILVASFVTRLPFNSIELGDVHIIFVFVYYVFLILILRLRKLIKYKNV